MSSLPPAYDPAELARSVVERERQRRADTFDLAVQSDPVAYRRSRALAAELQTTPDVVQADPERAEQILRETEAERVQARARDARLYPALAAAMTRHDFAAASADDIEFLQQTDGAFGWLRTKWQAGGLATELGLIGARLAARQSVDAAADKARAREIRRRMSLLPDRDGMLGFLGEATEILGQQASTVPAALGVGGAAAGAATLGGPVAAGTAFTAGTLSAMAAQSAAIEGGSAFLDYVAAGYDEDTARAAALGVGLVNGALEAVGFGAFAAPARKMFGKLALQRAASVTAKTAGGAWGAFAKDYFRAVAAETGTEMLQEVVTIAGAEVARSYSRPELASIMSTEAGREEVYARVLGAGEKALKGMLLLGLPAPTVNLYIDSKRAQAAAVQQTFVQKLADGATASKMAAETPELYRQLVANAADAEGTLDFKVPQLYVDRTALREVVQAAEVARLAGKEQGETVMDTLRTLMPDVAKELESTAEGDVVIPTADFGAHLARTDLGRALVPHVRLSRDAISAAEATRYDGVLKEFAEKAKQVLKTASESFTEEAKAVREEVLGELRRVKARPETEVRLQATAYTNFVIANAPRVGLSPKQFHERFAPKTTAQPVAEAPELFTQPEEATPAGDMPAAPPDEKATPREGTKPAERKPAPSRGTYDPRTATINLGPNADASTWFHELAHHFLTVFEQMVAMPEATEQVRADWTALLKWFDVAPEAWAGFSAEQKRVYHEQFAFSWENYLQDGRAPTAELQPLFRRVRDWITAVYRSLHTSPAALFRGEFGRDLPELTPEVREVMGRLLAADDAVRAGLAVHDALPLFQTKAEFTARGGDPEEWQAWLDAQAERDGAAIDKLTATSVRDLRWTRFARERLLKRHSTEQMATRESLRATAEANVDAQPVFKLRAWILGENGQPKNKLHRELTTARVPKGQDPGALARFVINDGMEPELAAQANDYPDAQSMVNDLLAMPPRDMAVEMELDALMLAEHGEMMDPKQVERAVDLALANEARARMVAIELKVVEAAKAPARVIAAAAKQAAQEAIGNKQVSEATPRQFRAQAQRAARTAVIAMKEGNDAQVIASKREELLATQLAVAAVEVQGDVESAVKAWRKAFDTDERVVKTRDLALVNAARAILVAHRFGANEAQQARLLARSEEFLRQLQAYDAPLYTQIRAQIDAATTDAKDWQELSVDEFRALRASFDALWHHAKQVRTAEIEGTAVQVEDVRRQLKEKLAVIAKPVEGRAAALNKRALAVRAFQGLRSAATRAEHAFDLWDNAQPGQAAGPWTQFIYRPIQKAIDAYRIERNRYVERYVKLIEGLGPLSRAKIDAPEIGYTFGAGNNGVGIAELLGALLHAGNKSNLSKLLVGRGWIDPRTAFDEKGNLDTTQWDAMVKRLENAGVITKAHWDFVQAVWDLNDEIKPFAQRAHKKLFGRFFDEVKGWPVKTSFGTYRGGYVPAKADPVLNKDAARTRSMEELEADFRQEMPSTGMGFTISRVEGYRGKLAIDIRQGARHIDEVLRFSFLQPPVRTALTILRSDDMRDAIASVDPAAETGWILPWLGRVARQSTSVAGDQTMDKFWNAVRNRTGMSTMFLNLSNALQQFTGLFPAALRAKGYVRGAFWRYWTGGRKAMFDQVAELSPFMANRMENQVFDVKDALDELVMQPGRFTRLQKWSNRHGYVLQQVFQNQVDVITWTAAFEKSMAESKGMDPAAAQKEAVAQADAAVRLTQGGTQPETMARFEAGPAFVKVFTQFQGYFNMLANLNVGEFTKLVRQLGWRNGKSQLFYVFFFGFMAPVLVAEAIGRGLRGEFDDEDDDGYEDEFFDWTFGGLARGALALVPFGGNAAAVALNSWNDKPYDDRLMTSPSISALESATVGVVRAGIRAADPESEVSGKNIRDVLTLITLLSGIPVSVLGRPAGYLTDVARGKVEPYNAADALRGAVTGAAAPGSRD